MSRSADKTQEIYNFLLDTFRRAYLSDQSKKFKRSTKIRFPSQESIIAFVYKSPKYVESNSYSQNTLKPDQVSVSKNTIRKAISQLIVDGKIEKREQGFQYVPQLDDKIGMHPVLDISSQIPIHIGVPENILLLTVENGMTNSVAEYLTSQFFNEDIVFLPIGKHILCISLIPSSVIENPHRAASPAHSHFLLRRRIELILHQFKLDYRDFPYCSFYETDYLYKYHPDIKKDLVRVAKMSPGNMYENLTALQRVLTWDSEALLDLQYKDLLLDDDDDDVEDSEAPPNPAVLDLYTQM